MITNRKKGNESVYSTFILEICPPCAVWIENGSVYSGDKDAQQAA